MPSMKMKVQKKATAIMMCLRQTMMITRVTRHVVHTCKPVTEALQPSMTDTSTRLVSTLDNTRSSHDL